MEGKSLLCLCSFILSSLCPKSFHCSILFHPQPRTAPSELCPRHMCISAWTSLEKRWKALNSWTKLLAPTRYCPLAWPGCLTTCGPTSEAAVAEAAGIVAVLTVSYISPHLINHQSTQLPLSSLPLRILMNLLMILFVTSLWIWETSIKLISLSSSPVHKVTISLSRFFLSRRFAFLYNTSRNSWTSSSRNRTMVIYSLIQL